MSLNGIPPIAVIAAMMKCATEVTRVKIKLEDGTEQEVDVPQLQIDRAEDGTLVAVFPLAACLYFKENAHMMNSQLIKNADDPNPYNQMLCVSFKKADLTPALVGLDGNRIRTEDETAKKVAEDMLNKIAVTDVPN